MPISLKLPELSLYIHIPWCIQKCPYCDFNSYNLKSNIPEEQYIAALLEDLDNDIKKYQLDKNRRPLHSIFIGGGTPSLISSQGINNLLSGIRSRIPFQSDIEITLEANPSTTETKRFVDYQNAGITRISIGIQSFNSKKLERLGRTHGQQEAIDSILLARDIHLNSFNLDLMYGLPDQNVEEALLDLDQAIKLDPRHLSWYQLTIEPNTMFYYKKPTLPDNNIWNIFNKGHKKLSEAGYVQYEISSYSKIGYQCQHNLNYWRFGDYLGIGCGSHGKLSFDNNTILRTTKIKHPKGYLDVYQKSTKSYLFEEFEVPNKDKPFEFFMNRFRLMEPCPKQDFIDRIGLNPESIRDIINWSVNNKYLISDEIYWKTTKKGKLFLNELLEAFME
ncbi:oxidoreductase [Candidatus Photodesmus blepharus]|uniref:Heme chaperone HemW n=1 Tax=Candidatus Photodesmus blepharonis TaxID=1179155 RepID=A0A084CM30_9GAMM|nr:radical SAM family heme chaperone HemW [Candidatus Photodesmus blepharus]KEY90859.1 oxidoreductase [Candidatus Photodesmus blepharus]